MAEVNGGGEGLELGGWLWLPAFGLVGAPIGLFCGLVDGVSWMVEAGLDAWNLAYMLSSMVVLVVAVYAEVLFFKRRKGAPTAIIWLLALGMGWRVLVDAITVKAGGGITVVPYVVSLAWIGYFMGSERVKATFVR